MNKYAVAVGLAFCVSPAVYAADTLPAPPELSPPVSGDRPAWALQITPYLWATDLKGKISPFRRAPTINVERSFSDGIDDVNFAGFVNIWGRHGRFVFSGDVMYTNTTDGHASGSLPALPVPMPPGVDIKGSVDTKQFMATLQGGYRVLDMSSFTLDALGGVRYWHIANDVTVSALGMSRSYGESFSWVDPVIGAVEALRVHRYEPAFEGSGHYSGFDCLIVFQRNSLPSGQLTQEQASSSTRPQ